jgi:hypothetical protein
VVNRSLVPVVALGLFACASPLAVAQSTLPKTHPGKAPTGNPCTVSARDPFGDAAVATHVATTDVDMAQATYRLDGKQLVATITVPDLADHPNPIWAQAFAFTYRHADEGENYEWTPAGARRGTVPETPAAYDPAQQFVHAQWDDKHGRVVLRIPYSHATDNMSGTHEPRDVVRLDLASFHWPWDSTLVEDPPQDTIDMPKLAAGPCLRWLQVRH